MVRRPRRATLDMLGSRCWLGQMGLMRRQINVLLFFRVALIYSFPFYNSEDTVKVYASVCDPVEEAVAKIRQVLFVMMSGVQETLFTFK